MVFKKIIIKGTDRTKLSFDCQFMIDIYFVRYRIILCAFQVVGQVLDVGDDIRSVQFFKISVIQKPGGLISELNTFIMQKREKGVQIDSVSEPGQRAG